MACLEKTKDCRVLCDRKIRIGRGTLIQHFADRPSLAVILAHPNRQLRTFFDASWVHEKKHSFRSPAKDASLRRRIGWRLVKFDLGPGIAAVIAPRMPALAKIVPLLVTTRSKFENSSSRLGVETTYFPSERFP